MDTILTEISKHIVDTGITIIFLAIGAIQGLLLRWIRKVRADLEQTELQRQEAWNAHVWMNEHAKELLESVKITAKYGKQQQELLRFWGETTESLNHLQKEIQGVTERLNFLLQRGPEGIQNLLVEIKGELVRIHARLDFFQYPKKRNPQDP